MFIINFCLNMFRASLCPSSGEQRPCYSMWFIALVLLDVVGSGCGALRCRMRAALCTVITNKCVYYQAPGFRAFLEQLLSGFGKSVLLWDTNVRCRIHQFSASVIEFYLESLLCSLYCLVLC